MISTYGFTEAKMAWCECLFPVDAEPSGYHLYPDLGIVEIVDPKTGAAKEMAKRAKSSLPRWMLAGRAYCDTGQATLSRAGDP